MIKTLKVDNILQVNQTYFINDPSGELADSLGDIFRNSEYEVLICDLVHPERSTVNYNPFHYLKTEKDVLDLVDCIMSYTQGETDLFWNEGEKNLLCTCFFYIYESGLQERLGLNSIIQMIQNFMVYHGFLDRLFYFLPESSLAFAYYRQFQALPEREKLNIEIS